MTHTEVVLERLRTEAQLAKNGDKPILERSFNLALAEIERMLSDQQEIMHINNALRDGINSLRRAWFTGADIDNGAVAVECLRLFSLVTRANQQQEDSAKMSDQKFSYTRDIAPYADGSGYQAKVTVESTEDGPCLTIETSYRLPLSEWPNLRAAVDGIAKLVAEHADQQQSDSTEKT